MATNYINYNGQKAYDINYNGNKCYRVYLNNQLAYEKCPNKLILNLSGGVIQSARWLYIDPAENENYRVIFQTGGGGGHSVNLSGIKGKDIKSTMNSSELTSALKGLGGGGDGYFALGKYGAAPDNIYTLKGSGNCEGMDYNWNDVHLYLNIKDCVPEDSKPSDATNNYHAEFLHWEWSVNGHLEGRWFDTGKIFGTGRFSRDDSHIGVIYPGKIVDGKRVNSTNGQVELVCNSASKEIRVDICRCPNGSNYNSFEFV